MAICLIPPFAWRAALVWGVHRSPRRWLSASTLRQLRLRFVLHGIVWGLVPVLLFPALPHQVPVGGGIAASTLTMAAFDLGEGLSFLVCAAVPLAVRLVAEGSDVHGAMGIIILGFIHTPPRTSRRGCARCSTGRCDGSRRVRYFGAVR